MPLSRLENFLKNVQGNVLYVNPEELDATDDVSNRGNSRTRPFKTIQRALIESARFSYQPGQDNDRFDKTTIHVSTGVHYIDNTIYKMYRSYHGRCPYAHKASTELITLPIHLGITKNDIEYISSIVNKTRE